MININQFYKEAFKRNIVIFTEQEQEKLKNCRIAIPGMGGVVGVHLITLTRLGIGNFNIADFDSFDIVNTNRQYGATTKTYGKNKLAVMRDAALDINPYLNINEFHNGINKNNIDEFLEGVDVVIDSIDFFCFEERQMIFKKAYDKGIYVITAGPMGFSSAVLIFSPYGMNFDEYFNINDNMSDQEKYLSFAVGLSPKLPHLKYIDKNSVNLQSKSGPSTIIACQLCAGIAATEVIKILLNKGKIKAVPYYKQYDPYLDKLYNKKLWLGNRNIIQRLKLFIAKYILKVT